MIRKYSIILVIYFIAISSIIIPPNAEGRPRISGNANKRNNQDVTHSVGVGMRFHKEHSNFESIPFCDDDKTYTLSYEYHEGIGYWLLAVGYTPELENDESIEHIITPQLSLIFKDRIYRAGVGILKSFVSDEDKIVEDTDIYYQFHAGISIPVLSRFSIDVSALYSFEKWSDIDFEFDDVEYGVIINYLF